MFIKSSHIKNFRERLSNEYASNPESYYELDINRAMVEDWQVERFILNNDNDEDKAFKAMIKAYQWKKSVGVHSRSDDYYPKEFYEINETQVSGPESEGRYLFWNSGRNVRKVPNEINPFIMQFIVHNIERLDRISGRNGMIMITDFSQISLTNYDSEQVKQVNQILFDYYPELLKDCYLINFPRVLIPFFKIFILFLNKNLKNKVKVISMDEIRTRVDIDMIPMSFGGNKPDIIEYPQTVQPLDECTHFEISGKQKKVFMDFHQKILKQME